MRLKSNDRKQINTAMLDHLFTQGEAGVDEVTIQLPMQYGQTDLTSLGWSVQLVGEKDSFVSKVLEKEVEEDALILHWLVDEDCTAAAGKVKVTVVGISEDGKTAIKFDGNTVFVKEAAYGSFAPAPDTLAAALLQVQKASEEAVAAARSASIDAQAAQESASRSPYIGEDGFWCVFDKEVGEYTKSEILAQGPAGPAGPKGEPGGVQSVNGVLPDENGNVAVQTAGVTYLPNLLDNWYFGNPVNQRGETEYTGITYGIDRWQGATSDTVVTVQNGSVAITGQVYQKSEIPFDNLAGKTVTLSAMEADGTLHNIICIIPTTKPTAYSTIQDTEKLRFAFDGTYFRSQLKSGAFVAAKLELGEGQTLAHQDENENWVLNGIPNYAEELAKCQRYFIRLSGNYDSNGDFVAIGFNNSTNQMRALVTLPATMRAKPVCAFYNIVDKDGANITLNYLGWGAGGSDRYTLVCTMETARTANEINAVRFGANGYIDFDANL